jgi:hypothetical protein
MARLTSFRGVGPMLAMLAVLLLGIGVGNALASVGPSVAGGHSTRAAIDLTRHTNVIVPGVTGSRGSLDVSCPMGTVIGGGFSAGRNLRIVESRPHGIRSWRVSWMQTSTDDTVAYAYAVCMR